MNNQLQYYDDYEHPHASYPDAEDEQGDDDEESRLQILVNGHETTLQELTLMHLKGLREQESKFVQYHYYTPIKAIVTLIVTLGTAILFSLAFGHFLH